MKDFSLKPAPAAGAESTDDPATFIKAAMTWHFSEETGTPFWLKLRKTLDFDPLTDIGNFADCARFPDVSRLLRTTPVSELVPRGLAESYHPGVFESGGTSGAPKFVVVFREWIEEIVNWRVSGYIGQPGRPSGHTLAAVPTGPHVVGAINRVRAERLGGLFFTVDIDPRWVKRVLHDADGATAKRYTGHLVDQITDVVLAQDIRFLVTTPPILRAVMERPKLATRLRDGLAQVTVGGTQINLDEIAFIATELLPNCEFSASYGSTSALGEATSTLIRQGDRRIVYRSFAPFITYDVIDPESGRTVDYEERGTVVVSHISRYAFYPRIVERDSAVRLPAAGGSIGDQLADIRPIVATEGRKVIEGVY